VFYGSGPHLLTEVGSGAAMCPTGPYEPRVLSIKKILACLPVQLGTHVPNVRAHIFKTPYVRAIMCLQDVHAGSVVNTYKTYGHASTVRLQYGYSMMSVLWTTRLSLLQCQVTR
jgi:hypothetical protein